VRWAIVVLSGEEMWMNKRKRVADHKHRAVAKKLEDRRKAAAKPESTKKKVMA
jgi:hypothetical protein